MPKLSLAFDPSSSLSKGLYNINDKSLEYSTMEPELVRVSETELSFLKNRSIGVSEPENESWINCNGVIYAVGFLASSQLFTFERLSQLKSEITMPKVLAMVGAIAQRKRLPSKFDLSLGILLPYGEYEDRVNLEEHLRKSLSKFSYREQTYQVNLETFNCLPEGAGILLRGSSRTVSPKDRNILVVMIGYRNISYLLMERGLLTRGETEVLGFSWLTNRVVMATSGLKATNLIVPITQAGKTLNKTPLKALLKSQSSEFKKRELAQIIKAVKLARTEHLEALKSWLLSRRFPDISEIIFSGGTAHYYQEELEKFFGQTNYHWSPRLENQVKSLVGEARYQEEFTYRLTDLYGYYFYCQYLWKQMSKLITGVSKNVGV